MTHIQPTQKILTAIAALDIKIYPANDAPTSIAAYAKVYGVLRDVDSFYSLCKKCFKSVDIELVSIDEVEDLSEQNWQTQSNEKQLVLIEQAIKTNLLTIGDFYLVASSTISILPSPHHENALIQNLVEPRHRERLSEMLPNWDSRNSGRIKTLSKLSHASFISPSSTVQFTDVSKLEYAEIASLLRKKGAQNISYVISENRNWDARYWPVETILQLCIGSGYGIILSCLPGTLLYLETEDRNSRSIVEHLGPGN